MIPDKEQDRRVREHPILGKLKPAKPVFFYYNGNKTEAREGDTVASALIAQGILPFRTTLKTGEWRGVFCGIGRCTDCAMTVDGVPNTRTCITLVRDNMRVETQLGLGTWEPA
jgi:hypothetical protein